MNNDYSSIKDLAGMIFSTLEEKQNLNEAMEIYGSWNQLLSKLSQKYSSCKNLVGHTTVSDCKNGILLVEVDHPGWIQILKMYQKIILKEMNKKFEKEKITSIVFKMKGENYTLSNVKKPKEKPVLEENDNITEEMVAKKLEELKKKFKENE